MHPALRSTMHMTVCISISLRRVCGHPLPSVCIVPELEGLCAWLATPRPYAGRAPCAWSWLFERDSWAAGAFENGFFFSFDLEAAGRTAHGWLLGWDSAISTLTLARVTSRKACDSSRGRVCELIPGSSGAPQCRVRSELSRNSFCGASGSYEVV
ncbi:hypothetical protein L226DRAFT_213115 [Lentinus tigrinus ALCF2SS1-7]|uniref:Uncharacterized protein n=1 Tax=Lentinus tigrinus ALCF2SS1-6 TaxID=1328759 RepID=A0A5C2RYV4_9APHY|nr:hypothetical protein L227DRAFT_282054 [Lentinus tigrinus ALCF2SS1-6]RPD71019.1 hypothetical protein L226DRAFT_213115 [Lentinus tigrinus ALCF2SS1-7]